MGSFPSLLICCCNNDSDVLIFILLCVLLNAERVYRELSTILEGESDLDFASTMVQVAISYFSLFFINLA